MKERQKVQNVRSYKTRFVENIVVFIIIIIYLQFSVSISGPHSQPPIPTSTARFTFTADHQYLLNTHVFPSRDCTAKHAKWSADS